MVTLAPVVQVTTILPAPLVLTTSTLLGRDDIEPKLMVPRLEMGVARELPKAQPLTMVALTVKEAFAVSARAVELSRADNSSSK